jgi:hypothetical protein
MQEAWLRGNRHGKVRIRHDDRLAELSVPRAERDLLTFERRESRSGLRITALTAAKSVERARVVPSPMARTATQA